MFSWRARRQLLIMVLVLAVFVGTGLWVFQKFLPLPSCMDNKQNQGEFGIDCGASCAPCELKHPKPITTFWARSVKVRENVFDAAALIQNQNEVLSSGHVVYEFALFDEFGLVTRKIGETYLLAQERTSVIEPSIVTSRDPTRVEFRIMSIDWQVRKDIHPNVFAERREYKVITAGEKKQSAVDVSIFNSTSYDYKSVDVYVLVLDKDGNLLGTNRTVLKSVAAGSHNPVRLIWPGELAGTTVSVEVATRLNIFDPDLILKP